jgi:hypothetical protein
MKFGPFLIILTIFIVRSSGYRNNGVEVGDWSCRGKPTGIR